MEKIATLSRFEDAELYRLAQGYGVLPKRIIQNPDHPLTLTAVQPKGLTSYASLTITGSTRLDVPDALLLAARQAARDDLASEMAETEKSEPTFFPEPAVSIVEPASVTGRLVVPKSLSDVTDWRFDVSPMGVWPGRIRIDIPVNSIVDVMDWWEQGADGLAFAYDYHLTNEDSLSISIGTASTQSLSRTSDLSTASAWDALKAKIASSDPAPSNSQILTQISLSSRERHAALTLMKT